MKTCKKCGVKKSRDEFYKENRVKDGLQARCIKCCKADAIAVFRANPEPYRERARKQHEDPLHSRRRTLRKYGLELEDYDRMLKAQGGVCAICKCEESGHNMTDDFCIDHNHETNKVRGLLCSSCNLMLGKAKADKGNKLLLGALFYLKAA
jgi:hypothetical protein